MMIIPLTQGFVAWVDDEDYEALAVHRWYALVHGKCVYAARNLRLPNGTRGRELMHRVIASQPGGQDVDHKKHWFDERVVDNRRCNLRLVSCTENGRNRRKTGASTSSPFKGVSFARRDGKWVANIRFEGKQRTLGYFRVEAHAALAYDLAAVKHFGEFALTNFPVPGSTNWIFGPDCATLSA